MLQINDSGFFLAVVTRAGLLLWCWLPCKNSRHFCGHVFLLFVLSRMMFFQLGSRGYRRELGPNVMSGWQPVVWCQHFSACEMDGKLLTLFWNGTGNSRRTRRGYMSLLTKQQGLRWKKPKGTVRASLVLLQFAMRLDVFQSKLISRLTADRQQAAEIVVEKKNKT